MAEMCPSSRRVSDFAGVCTFVIPTGSVRLSELFSLMERREPASGINDWAMRQTSMEEVGLWVSTPPHQLVALRPR